MQNVTVTIDDRVALTVQSIEESITLSSTVGTQHLFPLPVSLHAQQRDEKTGVMFLRLSQ